jgi:hypothetical protein
MQEQLSMARVCSLWSAKLSATTGVLNTNILHAFLYIWICVCVCVCVCACNFLETKCPITVNFDRGGFTFCYFVINQHNYWQHNCSYSTLLQIWSKSEGSKPIIFYNRARMLIAHRDGRRNYYKILKR